jgi:CHAT domain-containing protein
LQTSLAVAESFQDTDTIGTVLVSLGRLAQLQNDPTSAINFYQQSASRSPDGIVHLQAQISQLNVLIQQQKFNDAQTLWLQVFPQLSSLPVSRALIDARINLAAHLMQWNGETAPPQTIVAQILAEAIQQAQALGDRHAESYALGNLGNLYERSQQWQEAQRLTEQALLLSQASNAADISYRWQWQLGRILKAQADKMPAPDRNYQTAIAAYTEAVNTLKSIRGDLVAVNIERQFSFQDSVEPIYRELVSLLLSPMPDGQTNPASLEQARQTIEALRLAELDNFFREACLNTNAVQIDQLDPNAAIIYPIILSDRLEVIVRIPQQPLRHYATAVSSTQVENYIIQLRQSVTSRFPSRELRPSLQRFYDWLIRPIAADLATSQVQTLAFILDGALRNVPMSALHDGNQFLVEQYSIALSPGLQLLAPRPIQQQRLSVLAAGITEARQGFSPLPSVANELTEIQSEVSTRILLNQDFTRTSFQQEIANDPAPIVHLATHGQVGSTLEDTFVLTWSDRIDINALNTLLESTELRRPVPIELLVLSACKTATSDRYATLGLAGIAVRSGARSTVASLWSVDDQATSELMIKFYDELVNQNVTKAEALRQAQLSVLRDPNYREHPYFWAPFVLLGNWL